MRVRTKLLFLALAATAMLSVTALPQQQQPDAAATSEGQTTGQKTPDDVAKQMQDHAQGIQQNAPTNADIDRTIYEKLHPDEQPKAAGTPQPKECTIANAIPCKSPVDLKLPSGLKAPGLGQLTK